MHPEQKIIYFDNAATTWPKPSNMIEAMTKFAGQVGANPGRAGHRLSVQSARIVYETRLQIAKLFNCSDPLRVVFTSNVTEAINLALLGLLQPGDHAITTSMEHNSVMRPLRFLAAKGVDVSVVPCSQTGFLDPDEIKKQICKNTKIIAMTHASNVTGTVLPIKEIGNIARENEILLLVDAAQTAGVLPLDIQDDKIDLLAFTGHKSLYGPMGTGGLVIGERVDLRRFNSLKMGGTGSNSEKEEQPSFLPDKFESGTMNVIGLAGLLASLRWIQVIGIDRIRAQEEELTQSLLAGMKANKDISLYGPSDSQQKTAVIPFTINGRDSAQIGEWLDERYNICCRVGLHCAPSAAKTIGVFPHGTIRFSLGYFNTLSEVEFALHALEEITKG